VHLRKTGRRRKSDKSTDQYGLYSILDFVTGSMTLGVNHGFRVVFADNIGKTISRGILS
jgi:hypothetical protein